MDFLLAALSPAFSKILEVSFLTGYATAYRLENARKVKGGIPQLPPRSRQYLRSVSSASTAALYRTGSSGGTVGAKALANDPQRQGNIWHRYEQLENATKSLSNVNQQLVEERARHKLEKKRLEDAIVELRQQNEQLKASSMGAQGTVLQAAGLQPVSLSEESRAVMREIDAPEDSKQLVMELNEAKQEVQRLTEEVSDAHNQLEFLRSENQALSAEVSALQRRAAGDTGGRRRPLLASTSASPATPFAQDGPSVANFADEVANVAAGKRGAQHAEGPQLTSFGSDIESHPPTESLISTQTSSELGRAAAASTAASGIPAQVAALQTENKLLKDKLAAVKMEAAASGAVGGGILVGSTATVKNLQEHNRRLAEENQRLQNKVLRVEQEPVRAVELEEKYNKLLEENTRLQSKVVRLNLGAPQVGTGDAALIEELREENAELREDNDKLVAYLESLERKKKDLEDFAAQAQSAQGGVSAAGELNQFVQLKSENRRLTEEVAKLRKRLEDHKLNSTGSFQTVPIPVHAETGEEMDKDLWMLVEELRDQNRHLIEQLDAGVRAGGTVGRQTADQASETEVDVRMEDLQRQLAAVMESKAAEINEDNLRLVNHLSDENAALEQENMRLMKKLAAAGGLADSDVLRDTIGSNERLLAEKQKVDSECRKLAEKNTRLISENEGLLKQISNPDGTLRAPDALLRTGSLGSTGGAPPIQAANKQRSLFSTLSRGFRKRSSKDMRGDDEDLAPSSAEASMSSKEGAARDHQGAPRQLVQELIEENTKLFEENKKLGSSMASIRELADANQTLQDENQRMQAGMGLVKELTDENTKLIEENKQLTDRCLAENRDLSNRLINVAFQNEDDMFDAAFGGDKLPTPRPASQGLSAQDVEKRQLEMAEQMKLAEEQQQRDALRRNELSARVTDQLQAYEKVKASSAAAHKKSAASAAARLSSLNQRAYELKGSSPQPGLESREHSRQATTSPQLEGNEGAFDEGLKRRREADLARAELNKKIDASRKKREKGVSPGSTSPSEERHGGNRVEREADAKAFFLHGGNDDLGSFMNELGYAGFSAGSPLDEGELIDVYQQAMNATAATLIDPTKSVEEKALANSTQRSLQEWYAEYTSG